MKIRNARFPSISFLVSVLLIIPSMAAADGCFVWKNRDIDILEPEQKAVLLFDEGWEDLILEVKYEGPASEFGWIVPLPAKPEMSPAKARVFEELSWHTQEPQHGQSLRGRRLEGGRLGKHADSSVRVLDKRRVGIYDTVILASDSGDALKDWLRDHDYRLPGRAGAVLDAYARNGWIFVAMRIAPETADSTRVDRKLRSGTIEPIRFRFRTPEPVFPLKVSSINSGESDILLYLLARDQFVNRTCRRGKWETRMCGPMDIASVDPDSHYSAKGGSSFFVSKLRATLSPDDMEDLTFSTYDPVPRLRSADVRDRIEAASYIGWKKKADAVGPLVAFLDGQDPPVSMVRDGVSALWALGEIRAREAVPCLTRWASSPPSSISLEALNSLSLIADPATLPVFIGAIERTSFLGERNVTALAIRSLAIETLVAKGDSSSLPYLRQVPVMPRRASRGWSPTKRRPEAPAQSRLLRPAVTRTPGGRSSMP